MTATYVEFVYGNITPGLMLGKAGSSPALYVKRC
jgi:hypothetical protein